MNVDSVVEDENSLDFPIGEVNQKKSNVIAILKREIDAAVPNVRNKLNGEILAQ